MWCQYPQPHRSFLLTGGGSWFRGPGWLATAPCAGVLPNDVGTAHGEQVFPGAWVRVTSCAREECEHCALTLLHQELIERVINVSDVA